MRQTGSDRLRLGITTNAAACTAPDVPFPTMDVQPVRLLREMRVPPPARPMHARHVDCGSQSSRTAGVFQFCEPPSDRAQSSVGSWKGAERIATKGPVSWNNCNAWITEAFYEVFERTRTQDLALPVDFRPRRSPAGGGTSSRTNSARFRGHS